MCTFGQGDRPKVVYIHDCLVHFQREGLHWRFDLHAAVADQDVHTAEALEDLCDDAGHTVHVTEIQQH